MDSAKNSNRDLAIDILRVVAVLSVVLIHTTTRTLEASGFNLQQFGFSLFLNQIVRYAAPLFFSISGFVLELTYSGPINYSVYFKKRLGKIALPYLFWSLIYYFWIYPGQSVGLFLTLLSGNASYQLYFIPAIIFFYCLFPILHRWYKTLTRLWIFSALALVQVALLYRDYFIQPLKLSAPVDAIIFNFFIFFLGIVAARNRLLILNIFRKYKIWLIMTTAALGLQIFIEGRGRYLGTRNYLSFYSQWRPDVLLYTIVIGILLYGAFTALSPLPRLGRWLSYLSYFVFYCHIAILEMVWRYVKSYYSLPGFDIFFFLIVAGVSVVLAHLVRKIPKISALTG